MFSVTPATGEIKEEKPSPQATDTPAGSEYIAETGYHVGAAAEMTPDQEIRARALECAVRLWAGYGIRADEKEDAVTEEFWRSAKQFEIYIRDGK